MTTATTERNLGARGSRGEVAGPDPAGPLSDQAAAVLAAVPAWWAQRVRDAGLHARWSSVTDAVPAPMPAAVTEADPSMLITGATSPADLGTAYVNSLSTGVRARHGRHYTPPLLADRLWAMTRSALGHGARAAQLRGLVRDPACGAGALLLPVVREHVQASVHTDPALALAGLRNLIEGSDLDPAAVWLANVCLAAEMLPLLSALPSARQKALPVLISCADGLDAPERHASAVVMNPPYGRVRLEAEERERWAHVLHGHANLYGLFMGAALEGLDEKGVLAALVPTSFTSGLYFSNLRRTLSQEAPLREVTFVAERDGVFSKVLQETCLAVFDRRRSRKTTLMSINGKLSPVAKVPSPRGGMPWLLPRRADDAVVAATATTLPLRLADLGYRCSTGPLVWNRRADDLSPETAAGRVPVIWAADIDGGRVHRDCRRDALRFLTIRGKDEKTLVLSEPAVLVQRTTAPEQTRRLVAAVLTEADLKTWGGRVVVENHVNVLRPTIAAPLVSARLLAAVLSSEPLDRVVRSISGSVAVSAYEIEALPLPSEEVLRAWEGLPDDELAAAIGAVYRPGVS